jgi:hypothetical protein
MPHDGGMARTPTVKLEVFDPALCCSTGVCGPSVDPALARFAGDLEWLKARGVAVERRNLAQEPGAFAANAVVRAALQARGPACLPLVLADGAVAAAGAYPDRAKLAEIAGVAPDPEPSRPVVEIDFLYLDLETCDRCVRTDRHLAAAMDDVRAALGAAGYDVTFRRTHVETAAQALSLGLVTSPTLRVNGHDAAVEFRENACGDCGACAGTTVTCRVWLHRGREFEVPPKEALVDAVLRAVYAPKGEPARPSCALPENLLGYFRGKRRKESGRRLPVVPSPGGCP